MPGGVNVGVVGPLQVAEGASRQCLHTPMHSGWRFERYLHAEPSRIGLDCRALGRFLTRSPKEQQSRVEELVGSVVWPWVRGCAWCAGSIVV